MTGAETVRRTTFRRESAAVWLPSLSGLRLGAVLLVFGFHIHAAEVLVGGAVKSAVTWLFGPGASGVSLFFALGGFLLTWTARPGRTAARFWWQRLVKIYPIHGATSLAALVGAVLAGASVSAMIVLPNLLLLHVWIPDARVFFGLNTVSWFLACEAFFYALFPLLYRGLCALPERALWPATLAAFAVTWAIPLAALPLPEVARYWVVWILPVARLPEFVSGMLLARIVRDGRWPSLRVAPLAVVAGVAYFASVLLPVEFRHVAATAAPLALLVAGLGAADAARASRGSRADRAQLAVRLEPPGQPHAAGWRFRWMVRLGEYGFAFFMVHQLALRAVVWLAGPVESVAQSVAVVTAAFVVAMIGSWLLHHLVTVPALRLFSGAESRGEQCGDASDRPPIPA